MGINITSDSYNNYIGKLTSCMISSNENDFTIIFQKKEDLKNNETKLETEKELALPLLVINYEEIISNSIPNCRILYNNNLNTETIISGYIIGKIFRKEDIKDVSNKITNNIDELLKDENLSNELKPLIEEAEFADDFDFSKLEDQMFEIIDKKLSSL